MRAQSVCIDDDAGDDDGGSVCMMPSDGGAVQRGDASIIEPQPDSGATDDAGDPEDDSARRPVQEELF